MSGLDGGAPAPTAGTGGEDVSVRGQVPAQPERARSLQQQSDDLDARVAAKVHAAHRGEAPRPATSLGRAPDGKFLPAGVTNIHAPAPVAKPAAPTTSEAAPQTSAKAVSPDVQTQVQGAASETETAAAAADPEIEKIKGEHATYKAKVDALTKRDAQWTEIAERSLGRLQTLGKQLQQAHALLRQHGVSVDPRDMELARYREREHVSALAEERVTAERQAAAQARAEQERAARYSGLVTATKAAMAEHPQVTAGSQPWLKAIYLIQRQNADPRTAFALVAQEQAKTAAPAPNANVPRTLSGSGAPGGGGPRLKDPRDIAEKWKASLGAGAR
jgi:hypothetical protein